MSLEYLEDHDCGKRQSQSQYTVVIVYIFISEARNLRFYPVCLVVFLRDTQGYLFTQMPTVRGKWFRKHSNL
jgi:hypothetical protein